MIRPRFFCSRLATLNFDLPALRQQFPFFSAHPDWIYLDNAATLHKPQAVFDAMNTVLQPAQQQCAPLRPWLKPTSHSCV